MKNSILICALMILLSGCNRTTVGVNRPTKGVDVGNGGDTYAGEFVEIGYEIVEILIHQPLAYLRAEELMETIKATKVVSAESLAKDGKPIDALNFPNVSPARIELSRVAWDRMRLERHEKIRLVLHEYLGIMRKDDSNYQLSRRIDRASVCSRHPAVREYLENEMRRSCYRITLDDLRFVRTLSLSGKGIRELKAGDFDYLYSLESLSLRDNEIVTIPRGLFHDLRALRTLDLSYNRIRDVLPHTFSGLSRLGVLNLYRNEISVWREAMFDGLRVDRVGLSASLDSTYIELGFNPITKLEKGAFRGLSTKTIYLGVLTQIEAQAFSGVDRLERLGLEINLDAGHFKDVAPNAEGTFRIDFLTCEKVSYYTDSFRVCRFGNEK